jgi:hypothetical protein
MDFNIDKYLALKKELDKLRYQVKERRASFGEHYTILIKEILRFEILISDLICWKKRKNYQMLLKDFSERKITTSQFEIMFRKLRSDDDDKLTAIQKGTSNQNDPIFLEIESIAETDYILMERFAKLIETLNSILENYDSELSGFKCNEYQMSENGLLAYVRDFAFPHHSNYFQK